MTINEAIQRVDSLVPNTFAELDKVYWLSTLDARIKLEVIDIHEGGDDVPFSEYDESTDTCTSLLVPSAYSELYIHFLESKIHYYNKETDSYNNAIIMFNHAFEAYKEWYHRTHRPLRLKRGFHH